MLYLTETETTDVNVESGVCVIETRYCVGAFFQLSQLIFKLFCNPFVFAYWGLKAVKVELWRDFC